MAPRDPVNALEKLSKWDRVALVGLFPLFVARFLATFILRRNPDLHWRQRLALAFLQAQRASFPTRHVRWLNRRVSTGEAILRHCNKNKIPHSTVTLDDTTISDNAAEASVPALTLHFLTPPAAPENESGPTLLYFHGGGFVNPLRGDAHMPFIMRCGEACRAKQVVVLEYALAPEHPYPAQLVHCVATLQYLLDKMGLQPGDLVLAGDSAGGQLVGALLAHLVNPSPYAAPIKLDGQFRAALFVSPFVRLREGVGSYETNDGKDYLNRAQVDGFMSAWKGNAEEIWADLCGANGSGDVWRQVFARGSQGLVQKAMVTVGTADILLDSCRLFAKEHVQAETVLAGRETDYRVFEGKEMVLAECEGEVHVQVALDSVVGYGKGSMEHAIMSWLAHL